MSTAYVVVTVLAAAMVGYSAYAVFTHAAFVVEALENYGVPRSWWPWLGTAKAAGAAGLLVGLVVPAVGVMAAIGLVLYFVGAEITVLRARWYRNLQVPLIYVAPVVASFALGFSA